MFATGTGVKARVLNDVHVSALKSVRVRETFYSLDACGRT
jgi:hypothetical protein